MPVPELFVSTNEVSLRRLSRFVEPEVSVLPDRPVFLEDEPRPFPSPISMIFLTALYFNSNTLPMEVVWEKIFDKMKLSLENCKIDNGET